MDVASDFLPPGGRTRSTQTLYEDDKGMLGMLSQRSIRRATERTRDVSPSETRANMILTSDLVHMHNTPCLSIEESSRIGDLAKVKSWTYERDHLSIPSFGPDFDCDPLSDSFFDHSDNFVGMTPKGCVQQRRREFAAPKMHSRKLKREFDAPMPNVKRRKRTGNSDEEMFVENYRAVRHDSLGNTTASTEATEEIQPIDFHPDFDVEEVRVRLVALESAMDNSTKTQQRIHEWDKQMGLKRSHSKTMRLSSQSRKKALEVLKDEITSV